MKRKDEHALSFTYWLKASTSESRYIVARITYQGQRYNFATGFATLRAAWSPQKHRVIGSNAQSKYINKQLDTIEQDVYRQAMRLEIAGEMSLEHLIRTIHPENAKTWLNLIELHKEQEANIITEGTMRSYDCTNNVWQEFLSSLHEDGTIELNRIDGPMIDKFYTWCLKRERCNRNGAIKHIAKLRHLFNLARRAGYMKGDNPCTNHTWSKERYNRQYLTKAELQVLTNYARQHLQDAALRAFVFACYTGISFTDIVSLPPQAITDNILRYTRHKTSIPVVVPLCSIALEFYNPKGWNKLVNQVTNYHLHKICRALQINERVTFHSSRHTFATTVALNNGVAMESVSKMLGHSNIRTTQIYGRITEQRLVNDITNLNNRL